MQENDVNEPIDEDVDELISCLSDKEKKKIKGGNILSKIFKKRKMKREAEQLETYDAMIDNIKEDSVDEIIPEEYKKYVKGE